MDNEERDPAEVLVVRPFGRKGENFSMRDFDRGAMQFHFGIQPTEVVGVDEDPDGDGYINEVTTGEMTALHVFDVTNPPPFMNWLNRQARLGQFMFYNAGCASCHIPDLITESSKLPLAFPEVPHDPQANVYMEIDLRKVGFRRRLGGGIVVPLFSDLKRHKMGPELAETFAFGEIANDEFITARLWGIADTAPYMHDGRATTIEDAIRMHGGEAQEARDNFVALTEEEQANLLFFLSKLRTPVAPNEELTANSLSGRSSKTGSKSWLLLHGAELSVQPGLQLCHAFFQRFDSLEQFIPDFGTAGNGSSLLRRIRNLGLATKQMCKPPFLLARLFRQGHSKS